MLQIAICDDAKDAKNIKGMIEKVLQMYSIRYNVQVFDTGEELLDSSVSFDLGKR